MKEVEVIKIPVRYNGTTYSEGESFEMEEDHVNETLVKVIGDVAPKTVEEMTVPELKKYAQENEISLGESKNKKEILEAIKAAEKGDTPPNTDNNTDGEDDQTPPGE